jgi:hypothetical protein
MKAKIPLPVPAHGSFFSAPIVPQEQCRACYDRLSRVLHFFPQWDDLTAGGQRNSLDTQNVRPAQESAPAPNASPKSAELAPASAQQNPQTADPGAEKADVPLTGLHTFSITNPEVRPDGSIKFGDKSVFLDEVEPFTRKDVCSRASGERWACGLYAFAALQNSIANQTIACSERSATERSVNASCRANGLNIADFVLKSGLARLRPTVSDPDLGRIQERAQTARIGIWDR